MDISDEMHHYRFQCRSFAEFSRSMKLFIKEPGACGWIKNGVKPGDVFYDIGANIGVYTIFAAQCIGANGKVYAFEPHSANFTRLLDNIRINQLGHVVVPCNFALNNRQGYFPFNYFSGRAATADSQLMSGEVKAETGGNGQMAEL